jgi:hypothetical protein
MILGIESCCLLTGVGAAMQCYGIAQEETGVRYEEAYKSRSYDCCLLRAFPS